MSRTWLRAALSAATAVAIAATAALAVSGPASADVVDPGRLGSITVHRFENPPVPTGLPADGSPVDTTGLAPIEGVEFAVRQILGVDLADPAGWALAHAASGSFDPADPVASLLAVPGVLGLGTPIALVTDASGTASTGPIPVGLYLVTEESRPAGVEPAAPVVVSVPLTDPVTDDWRYDVHIYPKSDVFGVDKTIDDLDVVAIGDEVGYRITTDIPPSPPIDEYRILDALDPRLTFVDATVAVSDGMAVTEGTDYLIDVDGANLLTVEFTAAGRAALAGAAGGEVELVVTAIVNGTGIIENQAVLELDAGVLSGSFPSPVAELRMGGATLRKVDGAGARLAGAEFGLYRSEADALADVDRIELDGRTSFVSGPSGEIVLEGLRYSDFAGGAPVGPGDPGYRTYWVAEIAAPAGYRPLGAPIEFEVTSATSAGGLVLEIENLRLLATPPPLAFTGLALGGAVLGGGALLAAGVVFLLLPALRRRHETTTSR